MNLFCPRFISFYQAKEFDVGYEDTQGFGGQTSFR